MKVLMFGWEFPPHITGGLGTACFGLTKGLLKQGVEVLFVVPKAYGDENQEAVRLLNASDVILDFSEESYQEYWKRLSYVEVGSNMIPYFSPDDYYHLINKETLEDIEHSKSIFSKQYLFSGKYGKDLMQEVSRYALVASKIALNNTFDVIHSHDWLTYPAGIAAKEVSGKPLVIHVHATEFDRSGDNVNQAVYDIERRGMELADKVITVSNLTRDIVINKYGISPDKIFTVHNAVEHFEQYSNTDFNKGVKEKIVTFLGRITYQKGPDYFVEAAYKVIKKYNNVRFVMAGSGDMMNRMIRRVAELQIADKFHFAGFLKGEDVDRMFGQSDVYVMPSVSEPFGISPLEAMRSSVPVIISKQSGVSEILHYALKVDFWDIDAIADCIFGLLHYDGLSEMFKKYGKTEVDNLKWENAAYLVKEVYKSALKI
ncbi:MAG: 4-alpha-glucanotransferase [Bacteroidetes bacterium GWA2_31_9]|nr:MAG: 4-alpha-glucanotransferase [Bacteroidetes bacterium GWA2_31_9]